MSVSVSVSLLLVGIFIGQLTFSVRQLPLARAELADKISSSLKTESASLHEAYTDQLSRKIENVKSSLTAFVSKSLEKAENQRALSSSNTQRDLIGIILSSSDELKKQLTLQRNSGQEEKKALLDKMSRLSDRLAEDLRHAASEKVEPSQNLQKFFDASIDRLTREFHRSNSELIETSQKLQKFLAESVVEMKSAAFQAIDRFLRGTGVESLDPSSDQDASSNQEFNPFFK